jgi:ferredoxin-NADP reductase
MIRSIVPLLENQRRMLPPQALIRNYTVKENSAIAAGSFKLLLEPLEEPMPSFSAGQWMGLHLLNPDGSDWAKAAYSFANAPSEGGTAVELGIKITGDFTQRASELKPGDVVRLQGPWGVFTFNKDAAHLVMFAGGIGITPLYSMIRESRAAGLSQQITLFYSNKRCEEAAYLSELQALADRDPSFHLVRVCTRESHTDDQIMTRRVDEAMIRAHVADPLAVDYVMCGPNPFMDNIVEILHTMGVDIKAKLKKERFD